MASSSSFASSSKYCPQWKYDVFLSFRGEDTRKTFTGHLYKSLMDRGLLTFLDDKRLDHGDSIPEELLKAIEESQVALIIFSKNYAASSWCLNELVKIMECKDKNGQTVIPIFYHVDPSHVRKQTESFADAFADHELKYKDDAEGMQKVRGWRTAITAAASLKGSVVFDGGIEAENIQEIVDHISKSCKSVYSLSSLQDVVGINTHLEKAKSLLEIERNDDVRIIGIWGMGGVGKTTIATAIFHTLSSQFKAACFLEDVKENAKKNHLFSLQNTLLSKLLGKKEDYVDNKHEGKCIIPSRLCYMKVLIVLDDIDHIDHLEYLAGDLGWFGNGSRVVVTTRNRDLIKKDDAIVYKVTPLPNHEATQLFNQHAFRKEDPDEHFKQLSLEVINHAKGLPLALKVWGSLLHKRDIDEWRRTVDKIKKKSDSKIVEKLKISYDGLESEEQKIFLDMACFFRGKKKKKVMQILESCDFEAEYGLDVLIKRSLVFLSSYGSIEMHDLIQDMGKYIVKMQKDVGECSRLWDTEDFEEVMVDNTGTKAMEAIWLQDIRNLCFRKKAMRNMKRLRILHINGIKSHSDSIEYLPNSLRWFDCESCSRRSLPENFEPRRLVHLDLRKSLLHHLWTGTKQLPFLHRLNLSWSKNLMGTPDFTGMPNLKYLYLQVCESLEEVDRSLGRCTKLVRLDLTGCKSLQRFPFVNVESLKYLRLRECSSLEKFPEILGRSKLKLDKPSGIWELTHTTKLDLTHMENLVALPSSIGMLKSLVKLNVSYCSKLESLPEEIGDLENLEKLRATFTLISQPPSSIVRLNKLKFLSFGKEIFDDDIDEMFGGWTEEILEYSDGLKDGVCFVFPQVNEGLHSLEILSLSYCNITDGGLPEDIGSLSSLKKLYLRRNNFEHLPPSIAQLGALQSLDLSHCEELKELPGFIGMPNLETLDLSDCMNLKEVHHSLGFLKKLCTLTLNNCKRLKRFPSLCIDSLEYLFLWGCSSVENFPEIVVSMNLELKIRISYLNLSGLENLVTLSSSICKLKSLVHLDVSNCSKLESLPRDIGGLENLETLYAKNTLISRPPSSIILLNKLKFLDLSYCNLIDGGLPEDIGSLSSLNELNLGGNNFKNLPRSIAQLGALRSLNLTECKWLTQLPKFPQQLETIHADWSNDSICNSLFQNISTLQHDISASDSLILRVITTGENIPSWFHHQGIDTNVSINLPENWYVPDNFLGFVLSYSGRLVETIAQLFPLCDDGMLWMSQKFTLPNYRPNSSKYTFYCFLVPIACLWDTSKENGKRPNDYRIIRLSFSGELKKFGFRLLYKDEPEHEASSSSCNDEPTELCTGLRRSRYDNEANFSYSKKQKSRSNISGSCL